MNLLKQIQTLFFALCPACSCCTEKTSGTFPALDKKGEPIIIAGSPITLEWHKTKDHTTMVKLQKQTLPVATEAFADEVRNFLLDDQLQFRKEYSFLSQPPSEGSAEEAHKASEANAIIEVARLDREKRVEFSRHQWEQWFETTAQAMKGLPFTYFFVMAKNNKGDILGFTAFYISPKLPQFFPEFDIYTEGDVVLDPLAVIPAAQGHGLATSMIFSILKLAPETKRILLGTRIWITNAIAMYTNLGFVEYKREGINVKFQYMVKK